MSHRSALRPSVTAWLALALVLALSQFTVSCRKTVSGQGKEVRSGGAATGPGTSSDALPGNDPNRKILEDNDQRLEELLRKEIEDRLKGDEALSLRIDELTRRLEALDKKLGEEIARLDLKDKELEEALKAEAKARIDAIAELIAQLKDPSSNLSIEIKADLNARIDILTGELDAFRAHADETYATKQQFRNLRKTVRSLEEAMTLLEGNLDAVENRLETRIHDEVATLRQETTTSIAELRGDIAQVRAELHTHIKNYRETIKELTLRSFMEAVRVRRLIAQLGRRVDTNVADLNQALVGLEGRVADLRHYQEGVESELRSKLGELADDHDALESDVAGLNQELAEAIADQRRLKISLQLKIDVMAKELERVRRIATNAEAMAGANKIAITALTDDLAKARAEFAAQLDQLKGLINNRVAEVKKFAIQIVQDLGNETKQRFVEINARIGDLEQRQGIILNVLVRLFINVLVSPGDLEDLRSALLPVSDRLSQAVEGLIGRDRALERFVIDAIDPVTDAHRLDVAALNRSFQALKAACPNQGGFDDPFASLGDREWFYHLARHYVIQLAIGARVGDPAIDKIFFGRDVALEGDDLATLLTAGLLPSYARATSKDCMIAVDAWASDLIFSTGAQSEKIRSAIQGSEAVKARVGELATQIARVKTEANSFMTIVVEALTGRFGSESATIDFLKAPGPDGVTLLEKIAELILERSHHQETLGDLMADRDRYIALARDVAELKDQTARNTQATSALTTQVASLNQAVAALSSSVDDLKSQVSGLKSSQVEAFNLIAAIAGRLGYGDLAQAAAESARQAGGAVDASLQNVPAQCLAVQHFYNHATNRDLAVTSCESHLSPRGVLLTDRQVTRCAIHGAWQQGNELVAYTWGNEREVDNGWYAEGTYAGGQRVGNGLLIRQYEPTDAKARELSQRAAGSVYPADGESTFMLRVFGRASKFRLDVTSVSAPSQDPYSVEVDAAPFQVAGGNAQIVYEIPVPKAIARLGACRWDRDIKVTAIDNQGNAASQSCVHRFHTFSPIVLDLAGKGTVATVNPLASKARFDLDANGIPNETGWITKDAGLLALDLNGNGRIDDGSELFGEATRRADGSLARDGYDALAALDANGDGLVDRRDPRFGELLVWIDIDGDGRSAVYELRTLATLGITGLATKAEPVPADQIIQSHGLPEGNLVKLMSRYFGPNRCGSEGCRSFDVYFGSAENFLVGK